jgi:hypothetical protein
VLRDGDDDELVAMGKYLVAFDDAAADEGHVEGVEVEFSVRFVQN